jgi:hypothetical protein
MPRSTAGSAGQDGCGGGLGEGLPFTIKGASAAQGGQPETWAPKSALAVLNHPGTTRLHLPGHRRRGRTGAAEAARGAHRQIPLRRAAMARWLPFVFPC